MLLLFNSERPLSYVAARAWVPYPTGGGVPSEPPCPRSWLSSAATVASPHPDRGKLVDLAGTAAHPLVRTVEAGVVGEPEALSWALTDDAKGWSPSFSYHSRAEAQARLRDEPWPMLVAQFRITCLVSSPPFVFAEWRLEAIQSGPLLVADDILIEASDRPVELAGASVVEMRLDRICAIHTYFDDAYLIETLLMDEAALARRHAGEET